jgi:quercetin dioxygenase-like cupin family protein
MAVDMNRDETEHAQAEPKLKTGSEIPAAKKLELINMVSYQSGAVVSRAVLGRKLGNVTLFAFDEEQRLSEHTAPFDVLADILEGAAEIVIEGERFELHAGEIILMPGNRPHALRAISRFKMLLIMIRS